MANNDQGGIPEEIKDKLSAFDESLSQIEASLQPLLDANQMELNEKLSPLEKAKLELVGAYTINSLFWMYLNVSGTNPKEHGVKQELDRIRSYMNRVKEIQDKANAPKLDKPASKRFVKSALWQAAKNKGQDSSSPFTSPIRSSDSEMAVPASSEATVSTSESNTDKHKDQDLMPPKKKRKKNKNK